MIFFIFITISYRSKTSVYRNVLFATYVFFWKTQPWCWSVVKRVSWIAAPFCLDYSSLTCQHWRNDPLNRLHSCCNIFTARCTLVQSAVLPSHVVCLSVRLSVTLVDCDHIGWNSSKIISSLVSQGCSLFAIPTWRVCSKGNTPKFGPKVTHPLLIWASETFDRKLQKNGYR